MTEIIIQISIVFILIAVGFIANKTKILDTEFSSKLSRLVILISCPCLVLSSVMGKDMPQRELILPLLLIGTMSHTVLAFIGYWLPRLFCEDTEKRGIYGFMLSFSNIGFIGYPVIASIFGHHALFTPPS